MKSWNHLTVSDIIVEDDAWGNEICYVDVKYKKREVHISLPRPEFANKTMVKFCKQALSEWSKNLKKNALRAEKHMRLFLPGRKVRPTEISVWDVEFFEPDGNPKPIQDGTPSGVEFMFNVEGDYSDPNYDLSQFCETTVLSLGFHVKDYVIDWEKPYLHMTNDFE